MASTLKIGRNQQKEFEKHWPKSFYKPLRRETKPMAANRKSIDIGDQTVIDVGVFYARALTLHASRRPGNPTIDTMLATELSPAATSMFTDYGDMRTTQKSHLKNELAVEKSHRTLLKDSYFLDGCAILWVIPWPAEINATIQDYVNAFRSYIRQYQKTCDVFLIFDRYVEGSTKEVIRNARSKGMTKVFKMKLCSRLPAPKLLFSVTSNKVQLINFIIQDLIEHKDDEAKHSLVVTGPEKIPIELYCGINIRRRDLETNKEEADTIILQQVNLHVNSNIMK